MVEEEEVIRPESEEDEEDGGGAVKSFLDHLEDLRWVLIKCGAAVIIGMIICLAAGNVLMQILMWPLERSAFVHPGKDHYLRLEVGTNILGTYRLPTNQVGNIDFGSNQLVTFQMVPLELGTNVIMALQTVTNRPGDILPRSPVTLLNLSPAGGFMVAFQLAIYGGIVLASPLVIFWIAQFVVPALRRNEKKYMFRGFCVGTGLFLSGVSFCYFVLLPFALNASRQYSNWLGIGADQWTAEQYISFTCKFMLGMGLGFEMPVVLLILVKLGILDYAKLVAMRKYMIVINLVLGAVLTTPEVVTQVLMALPLQILYEITIWIAWYWERRDKKRQAALDAADES